MAGSPSFTLSPQVKWYLVDNTGKPAGGGFLYVGRSLNPTQVKAVFQDPGGADAWPLNDNNQIVFDENGTQGPFYWEFDPNNPDEFYFLQAFDSSGNLLWTIDTYIPSADSIGSGGSVTTANDVENMVVNNVFWRSEIGAITPITVDTFISPSAHASFSTVQGGSLPDIRLLKNNTTATESLTITKFPYGDVPFLSPGNDITPELYLNYTCSVAGTSETFKYIQIPITAHTQNLSSATVTLRLWGQSLSGNPAIQVGFKQYFGDGGTPSAANIQFVSTQSLNASWQPITATTTITSVGGKTVGLCGNDALYMIVGFPLTDIFNINLTKFGMFLGNVIPAMDYRTYDRIDAVLNAPRTGFIDVNVGDFAPYGWVLMNDGYIGSADSLGTMPKVARANIDTFPLYDLIWNKVVDEWAPVEGGRGASSIVDFAANKPMALTKQLGRALASIGLASSGGVTTWVDGQTGGSETVTLTEAQLASHAHAITQTSFPILYDSGVAGVTPTGPGITGPIKESNALLAHATETAGSGTAHDNTQPTTFYNIRIKL